MKSSEFHPEAQDEFLEALRFYRRESAELARSFSNAVRRTVAEASDEISIGETLRPGVHRRRVARFPYDVIYESSDRELFVLAVAHHHRRPEYWSDRCS
jgi:plasmid stabilization system protein ParE